MGKQHEAEWKATGTDSISEPEVTYARQSRRSNTRKGVSQPDGEDEVAWKRQMDDFVAESLRIHESGDAAARKDFLRRMEAFMRENNTMERRLERIDRSLEQVRRGEVMTAQEADEAVRRALPWLR